MDYSTILLSQEEGVAWITLNRPEKLNAYNETLIRELRSVVEKLSLDRTVKVAVLRGAGRAFCSGQDLSTEAKTFREQNRADDALSALYEEGWNQHFGVRRQTTNMMWKSPVIFIAQIHGYCVTGGWELASACDLIIAADDAKILWRPLGGAGIYAPLWPHSIGMRKVRELIYNAEPVTGKEAAEMGMINRSVPAESLTEAVDAAATKIARRPREFLFLDKTALNKAFDEMGIDDARDYSFLAHALSHMQEPSKEVARAMSAGDTNEARQILDKRASLRAKKA